MARISGTKIVTAGALSVFALTLASPTPGSVVPMSAFSIAAIAQETGHPIIVNELQFKELADKGAKIVDVRPQAAYEA